MKYSLFIFFLFLSTYIVADESNQTKGLGTKRGPDTIKEQQEVMKKLEIEIESLNSLMEGKKRPSDVSKEILSHAVLLHALTEDIPGLFPESRKDEISGAEPKVWTKRPEFKLASESTKKKVAEFAEAAKSGDLKKIRFNYKRLDIASSCAACHEVFRKKNDMHSGIK